MVMQAFENREEFELIEMTSTCERVNLSGNLYLGSDSGYFWFNINTSLLFETCWK